MLGQTVQPGGPPARGVQALNQLAAVEQGFRVPPAAVVRLEFSPLGTGAAEGRKFVRYRVLAKGLDRSRGYILLSWDIGSDSPEVRLEHVKVDEKDVIACGQKEGCPENGPDETVELALSGKRGQPRRFVLMGENHRAVALGEVIPFPAEGRDGACAVEAVMLEPMATAVLIVGRGFAPGEMVRDSTASYGEAHQGTKAADEKGETVSVILPFVAGHASGSTTVTLKGAHCAPRTSFTWGVYDEEVPDPEMK